MIKTKQIILFFFLLFCGSMLNAQNGTVATGGDAAGSGGSASYSIGQIDYIAANDANFSVNQGLQQPYEISAVTGLSQTSVQLSVSVFPNPTSSTVVLNISDLDLTNLEYQLFDVQGKKISGAKITNEQTTVAMEALTKAIYFLKVIDKNNEVKTFKIVKN